MTEHIVLLGDSTLDNGDYTGGEPDVVTHLRDLLPAGWQATLCAVDGSTTDELPAQLLKVPADASRLVVSVGGNDALLNADVLDMPVASTAEALELFASRADVFESSYRRGLDAVLELGKPAVVCTIYNGQLGDGAEAHAARAGLRFFNDAILRVAFEHALPVIDLRLVCAAPEDYANPIEPSGLGGRKIAEAVLEAVGASRRGSIVIGPATP